MRYCNSPLLVQREPIPGPFPPQHAHPWAAVPPRGWIESRDNRVSRPDRLLATVHGGALPWPSSSASRWHSPESVELRSSQLSRPEVIYGGTEMTMGEEYRGDAWARVRTRSCSNSRSVSPSLRPRGTLGTLPADGARQSHRVRGPGKYYVAGSNVVPAQEALDGTRTSLVSESGHCAANGASLMAAPRGRCGSGDELRTPSAPGPGWCSAKKALTTLF